MGTYAHVRLLLCSAVIALTARGYPANRNIMPSPLRRNRPTTLLYPHRKLSRPWLVSLQEDLWRDGPSGDGPGDDTWSKLIPSAKSHVGYVSESEYKTHSPSPEDFFTTEALPFPTVIDTMIDESSTFEDEWISRTSMPYEGPSSLLNSFIFRPSVPYISPSSMKTPSLEESLPDSESDFPSWWDPSSIWKMSTRQAVSDAISDHYFIITAISATHIYSEREQTSYYDSISSKHLPEVSSIFSKFSVQDYLVTKKSDSLDEMPSPVSIAITKTLPAFSTRRQFYTSVGETFSSPYDFGYSLPLDEVHQSSKSNIRTSSSNISLSDNQTYFYSNTFSSGTDMPYILTRSYSNDFDKSIFKDSSSFADLSDYEVDKSAVFTFEQTSAKSVSLTTTQILYDSNVSFYTTTPFTSFKTSNIQATVTYIDYDRQSERFIMPTLTIRGTPLVSSHSNDTNEIYISSSYSETKSEIPHIASSFTDFNDVIPVISLWSLDSSPAENIISLEDTRTHVKNSHSEEFYKLTPELSSTRRFTPLTFRPAFTSTYSLFSDNEIANEYSLPSELSKLRSEVITAEDKQKTSVIEQFEHYYSPSSEQMFSSTTSQQDSKFPISMGESWANEIGADNSLSLSKQSTDIPLSHLKSVSTLGWNAISVGIDPFDVLTRISHPTTTSSINTDDLFSSVLIPSMGTITEKYGSQQEMTPTIASAFEIMSTNDETGDIKENLQTQYGSATEFIDSSTHHVIVRSLSSSSHIDISESMLQNFVTSRESDIDKVPKLTYTHTLWPVFTSSELLVDNTTELEENTHLQEEINTQEYSPTYIESSFQDHKNLSYTSSSSPKYNGQNSQLSSDLGNDLLSLNHSTDDWHPSLKRTEFGASLVEPVDSQLYEMTPQFTTILEVYSKSKSFDSSGIQTESVSERISHIVPESIDTEYKQNFLTKKISPESGKTRNLFESAIGSTIQPKPSFIQKVSKDEGLFSTVTFDSENGIKSIESSNWQLQSSITDMHTQVRPSQTLLDSSDITQLESIVFRDLSTDKQFTEESEFLTTLNQEFSQIKIDSSMTFSHTMETEQTGVSPYIKKYISVSEYSYPETPILDGSISLSTKDYLSKDILHPSNNIPEGDFTRVETYSYFLFTPTIHWEVSGHIIKHTAVESEDYERSFAELSSEKTLALMSDTVSDSPVFNTDSKGLSSGTEYSSRSEFEYTGREDSPIFKSDFHSRMILQSASFETRFNFDQESVYDYHSLQLTMKPPLETHSKFDGNSKLKTEQTSKNLVNSESFTFSSGDTEFYSQTLELIPDQSITMHGESSSLGASSRETDSRLDIPSEFTKGESDIHPYTTVFTPENPISTFENSIWIGKLLSETTSVHLGISAPFIPVLSSYDTSLSRYVPEIAMSYPSIRMESSPVAGALETDIFHSTVDTSLETLGGSIPQTFSSGTVSKVYQTSEISPSQTIITLEKSQWVDGQQPQGEFQSRKELSFVSDPILGFISGEESIFYQTPVILSSRTITQVRSDCAASPCLVPENEPLNTEDKSILRGSSLSKHETLTLFSIEHSLTNKEQVATENVPYAFSSPSYNYAQTLQPEDLHKTEEPMSVESEFSIQKSEPKINLQSGIILQSSNFETQFSFNQESEYSYHTLHLTTQQTPKLDLPFNQIYSHSHKPSDPNITESDNSIKSAVPESIESDYSIKTAVPKSIESDDSIKTAVPKSIESDYSIKTAVPKSIESDYSIKTAVPKSIESDYSTKTAVPEGMELDYSTKPAVRKSIELDYSTKITVPKSIESDYSTTAAVPVSIESDYSTKTTVPTSIESNYSTKIAVPKSIESDYSTKTAVPNSIESYYSTKIAVPKSIESDYSTKTAVPNSIESDYSTKIAVPKSIESDYSSKIAVPKSIESDYFSKIAVPKSIESGYSIKTAVPKSIESDYSSKHPDTKSLKSDYSVKIPDPKSIESDHPLFSIHLTKSVLPSSTSFSIQETPLFTSTPILPVFKPLITATPKSMTASKVDSEEMTLVWQKESSTPGYDIEMASVLAISSFLGTNGSRNASTDLENGGIPETEWSKIDVRPTPSIDLTLFKDNNYWILTVLEAPVKGHLPENFSQTLEMRLANAYSEAFRSRSSKQGKGGPEDKVVVKILSLTNDLLLSQLDVVYVVERGGKLVPAILASEFLNFLRHEQLREFLGLYAILKAKPYRPDESAESHPVSSSIPVVTIVCSILGVLLFLFCCFCVYCRCCRPKQAEETSPSSSVSGSLQRSLAKHGQHNRKHLFQEMAHHLTTEMAVQRKQESVAPDIPEKEPPPQGKILPPLPSKEHEEAIDKAIKMLKILENKDSSTSPESGKQSSCQDKRTGEAATEKDTKKKLPKPKKRRKARESEEKSSKQEVNGNIDVSELRPLPPVPKEEGDIAATPDENRASPDSGTSSRHTSSSPASTSEKTSEELGSDGSNAELLPPLQDLIAKSKADSEAAAADTQIHLSRVRQRISELLDDAFALANGRKFYGSMRSKKINPATTEMFPRYASLRSQSAAESSVTRSEEESTSERRPISEGAQHLLGAITDDGQLITRPPPKSVWGHGEQEDTSTEVKYPEVTEAHNRHVNFFPFQQQSKLRQVSSSSSSSQLLPPLDPLQESEVAASTLSTISVLRDAASEVYLAHSSKIHPAAVDQYDEIDVVSALREGEPVADLIRAIKDELHKFSGSQNESNA